MSRFRLALRLGGCRGGDRANLRGGHVTADISDDYGPGEVRSLETSLGCPLDFTLTLAWSRAAEASGYGEGIRVAAFEAGQTTAVAQGILRRRASLRKIVCGSNGGVGAAWRPGHEETAGLCLQELIRRGRPHLFQAFLPSQPHVPGAAWEPSFTFHIDLKQTLDSIQARMTKAARYELRLGQRNGVSVRTGAGEADFNAAYDLIERSAKARRIPLPPRRYSLALHGEFAKAGAAVSVLATLDGRLVSAATLIGYGTKVSWWKGGSTDRGKAAGAGNLVQMAAIQWAKEKGFSVYDLGGTDPTRKQYAGIHSFKASLGGDLVEGRLAHMATRSARIASRVKRMLP